MSNPYSQHGPERHQPVRTGRKFKGWWALAIVLLVLWGVAGPILMYMLGFKNGFTKGLLATKEEMKQLVVETVAASSTEIKRAVGEAMTYSLDRVFSAGNSLTSGTAALTSYTANLASGVGAWTGDVLDGTGQSLSSAGSAVTSYTVSLGGSLADKAVSLGTGLLRREPKETTASAAGTTETAEAKAAPAVSQPAPADSADTTTTPGLTSRVTRRLGALWRRDDPSTPPASLKP